MDWLTPRAAYFHVPFCAHHCGYCDFAVSTGQEHLIELYLDAIAMETRGPTADVETIFIGGGTPTHLSEEQLTRLLTTVRERFPGSVAEFSIESTPESITAEKVKVLKSYGVTRVSIGVQSFENHTLYALDRRHGVEQIHAAVNAVKSESLDFSFDLIFGAPGQTLVGWTRDLNHAIAFEPNHISTYGLTYEKGTPLWKRWNAGEVRDVGEDAELAMYESSMDTLTAAGFEHYEISNFAKPGHRCRHNEYYWANHAYHGFGVGAARYANGERAHNVRDTKLYVQRVLAGEDATQQRESLPPRERAFETLAVQLRRCDGIDRKEFKHQTGYELDELAGVALSMLVSQGLLVNAGRRVQLTRRGKCLADGVVEKLMQTA